MGFIWDLIQQGQIGEARERATTLEQRVAQLEADVRRTNQILIGLLHGLERRFGQDLDNDGSVG